MRGAELTGGREFASHVGWRDNVEARGSGFWAPLALGEADGVPCPVVHQLVQVIREGAFGLLGQWGDARSGRLVLGMTGLLVVVVVGVRSTIRTGPTRSRGGGAEARHGWGGLKLMRRLVPRPLGTARGRRASLLLGAVGG